MTDASSKESKSADRWRRLGDRSEALLLGAVTFWRHVRELWRRMVNALHEEENRRPSVWQSSAPPRRHTERRDAPAPIRVSAQDGVFNFTVDASFTWSSDRLRREALSGYAHYYMPDVIGRLTHLAAEHAGRFAPHRAAGLEAKLQQVLLKEVPWHYPQGDRVVECVPQVRVRPDERVMRIAMPYWEQLIRIGSEFDVRKRRAEYAEQLSRKVVTVLENLGSSLATGGGQRTNEKLASDVEHLLAEHKATLRRLEDLFRETLRDSDIFGRATSGDIPKQGPDGKPPEAPQPADDSKSTDDSSARPRSA
ncbi:hypothetical protein GA0070624_4783 [Micromonospora rhizosphaerae]|uniref:Uncharacterized protein n=1 Tax=Micromonospora rhizosphaerae TaxID=568872 RepID=A0A1C6SVS9_9ACTN|nr:hypothetical protein [Micromonospora rhizosphaerae]SCL33641.1 hypothetical protein GA0070624_4783 [Micromonospora rhizosphaerae]